MDRRDYLQALAAAGAAGVAGCSAGGSGAPGTGTGTATGDGGTPTATAPGTDGTAANSPTQTPGEDGLPVPLSEFNRGAVKDQIPAITDPAFADDWSGLTVTYYDYRHDTEVTIEPRLRDYDKVIGVTQDGRARAYPLRVLRWHEVANDMFGGPQLVTYCPLCRTGVVADRTVNGDATIFGVSGLLYRSNLVMYDRATESLWSQVKAIALRGPKTGTRLSLRPASLTTWGDWLEVNPDSKVLLPPPESSTVKGRDATRNYNTNPYQRYEETSSVGVNREAEVDDRLHPKTLVIGIAHDGTAKAYPLPAIKEAGGLVNDTVNGLPVVVVNTGDETMAAYVRQVNGKTVDFQLTNQGRLQGAGSTWDAATGLALDGPHEGSQLKRANDRSPMYWFSWADVFPDTTIYGDTTST